MALLLRSRDLASEYGVIDHQDDDRSDNGDNHAVEIEAGDPACAKGAEDEAADDRADDAENNVEEKAFARFVHNLAGDVSCDEAKDNPPDDRHHTPRIVRNVPPLTKNHIYGRELACWISRPASTRTALLSGLTQLRSAVASARRRPANGRVMSYY